MVPAPDGPPQARNEGCHDMIRTDGGQRAARPRPESQAPQCSTQGASEDSARKVEFYLYKDPVLTTVYRELHLYVTVL